MIWRRSGLLNVLLDLFVLGKFFRAIYTLWMKRCTPLLRAAYILYYIMHTTNADSKLLATCFL